MNELLKEILDMIAEIPCICIDIYKNSRLCDPNCPRCNWIDEDIIKRANKILDE